MTKGFKKHSKSKDKSTTKEDHDSGGDYNYVCIGQTVPCAKAIPIADSLSFLRVLCFVDHDRPSAKEDQEVAN